MIINFCLGFEVAWKLNVCICQLKLAGIRKGSA